MKHTNTAATKKTAKNYYSLPEGYIIDPLVEFDKSDRSLWATDGISKDILSFAEDLSLNKIEGDLIADLPHIEREIRRNNLSYIVNGLLYAKIKFWKLYKKTHSCFDDYCKETFGVSAWQINYDIDSARVGLTLLVNGYGATEIPQNKTQCIPLHRYAGLELVNVWRSLIERFKPWQLTKTIINNFLHPKPLSQTIDTRVDVVNPDLRVFLDVLALIRKMSVYELIQYWCYKDYKSLNFDIKSVNFESISNPVDPEKMASWREDLQELVQEYQQNPEKFRDLEQPLEDFDQHFDDTT